MAASRLTDTFLLAAHAMCQRLNMSMPDLLVTSASEAGLDPAAHNPGGATGMIQIMNLPGVGFHEGWQAFAALSPEGQLPYIERYFAPYAGARLKTHERIHQALFLPATLGDGSDPDLVLCRRGGTRWGGLEAKAYSGNQGLDYGNKGYITVQDLATFDARAAGNPILRDAFSRIPGLIPELAPRVSTLQSELRASPKALPGPSPAPTTPGKSSPANDWLWGGAVLVGMGAATWYFYQKGR